MARAKKQMRKGTRSCVACRRRKVRCSYASSEASVCVHCARRKSVCVPQGDVQVECEYKDSQDPEVRPVGVLSDDGVSFFDALDGLRRRVAVSLGSPRSSSRDGQSNGCTWS
ncbi:hypothetical protein ASPWEDRAFT_166299 [Aspergillus wentii DTO 134E9]|uniref:Zn(2)-C6 fungal-type domain-containing protein n=1 Tax=Aspergillus wentii DTO 134E9 TaxID=1073089 RepID=A0A1L9RZE4_ASPWE|nr:uncharacterized protein ASPWEDRAFT_166299 [Aspergillus wentii DTO 134E9]KAI9932644.1 hypothetical protein MW887_008893 [Aspergillus wentii]OJJ40217.1 hypothetical protein ASPWEDRAFT_166299 [Aspergillus wentii DTO 134E9]